MRQRFYFFIFLFSSLESYTCNLQVLNPQPYQQITHGGEGVG